MPEGAIHLSVLSASAPAGGTPTRADVRAARGQPSAQRDAWVRRRAALRGFLGQVLERDPSTFVFAVDGNGRPHLAGEPTLDVSTSHSAGVTLLAVGVDARVGVDIEVVRSLLDVDGMCRRYLTASETRQVHGAPEPQLAFLDLWVRKEALVKALGVGLRVDLREVDVAATPTRVPPAWAVPSRNDWHLGEVALGPHHRSHVAAYAVSPPGALRHVAGR